MSNNILKNKLIHDPIHGCIEITPLMSMIIDTVEFQRLRDIKQLGSTHYIFPSATHTRFEHSIGVSHLARIICESIVKNHKDELLLNERDIELYRIAGLIHDIGHGPYSHLYDEYIIDDNEPEHEERGILIFKYMIKKYKLPILENEITNIINYINPPTEYIKNWKYQIIANKLNGIDVDKIDYIQRDNYHLGLKCGGDYSRILNMVKIKEISETKELILSWPEKINFDIYSLFNARYRLHKQIYTHHAVKSYDMLIVDILKKLPAHLRQAHCNDWVYADDKEEYGVYKYVGEWDAYINAGGRDSPTWQAWQVCNEEELKQRKLNKFLLLTDSIVNCRFLGRHLGISAIQTQLYTRKQMKLFGEFTIQKTYVFNKDNNISLFIDKLKQKIINENKVNMVNIIFNKTLIGLSSGENSDNPLNNVYYYSERLPNKSKSCYLLKSTYSSFMITNEFQEYIYRFYIDTNNFNNEHEKINNILNTCKIEFDKFIINDYNIDDSKEEIINNNDGQSCESTNDIVSLEKYDGNHRIDIDNKFEGDSLNSKIYVDGGCFSIEDANELSD